MSQSIPSDLEVLHESFEPIYASRSEIPKAKDIYYRCLRCGDVVPSAPRESIECRCRNVSIDTGYFRLDLEDPGQVQILKSRS